MYKRISLFFIILITSLAGIYFHTNTLVVSHHRISLGTGKKKLKLAHVTDLHSKSIGRIESQVFEALEKEKPDVIILTGDLATPSSGKEGYGAILGKLKAPRGTFFVQGNWEYWEPIPDLKNLLIQNGIIDLTNRSAKLDSNLWLAGFDDSEEGLPELNVLNDIPSTSSKIGLFHSPIFFEKLVGKTDLNFAGHSHGGQIRIPFYGPLWVPAGTGKYEQGWFTDGKSKLFVSRGIGTSVLPIRFNCSPELAIIDLYY